MTRVALATSAALPDLDAEDGPLVDALLERLVDAAGVVWNSRDVDWSAFDAVVIRSTWDYSEQRDHFVAWAEEVSSAVPLFNDAQTVRWNTHKGYLLDLEAQGVPIVPTTVLSQGSDVSVDEVLTDAGWDRAVAKLAVSAGGSNVHRIAAGEPAAQAVADDLLAMGDVLVQPYLERVTTEGELSVVLVDGEVTHAVRKRSEQGDFRTNSGLMVVRDTPDDEAIAVAVQSVEAAPVRTPLYARADLLADADGYRLVELELVEPSLFLTRAPHAADVLADALLARLKGRP